MESLLDQLIFIIPVFTIVFCFIIGSINLFSKIRRKFSIKVNCWFCNENFKVPYDESNCWICPDCEQYNGFNDDGDYNQEIPAQHFSKLNTSSNSSYCQSKIINKNTNGMCTHCNRNQELKMQQLAAFIPSHEDNFDEEVEDYKKQLEQSYRLCPRCEKVLKRALNKVKNNILGSKLAQIGAKGFSILDLHMATNQITATKKKEFFTKICFYTLVFLSVINLIKVTQNIEISKIRLETVFNPVTTQLIIQIVSYISVAKQLIILVYSYILNIPIVSQSTLFLGTVTQMIYLTVNPKESFINFWKVNIDFDEYKTINSDPDFMVNFAGILLSLSLIFLQGFQTIRQALVILIWSAGMVLPMIEKENIINDVILDGFKLFISSSIIFISYKSTELKLISTKSVKKFNDSFHRIYSEGNSDISDESDIESEIITTTTNRIKTSSPKLKHFSPKLNLSIKSIDTTKSISPSAFTASILNQPKSLNESFYNKSPSNFGGSKESVFNGSFYTAQPNELSMRSPSCFGSRESIFSSGRPQSAFGNPFENSGNVTQLPQPTYSIFNTPINCYNTSTFHTIPDDFQNKLNLGSKSNYLPGSPTTTQFSDLRQRTDVLTPSRLTVNTEPQPSWVAGGYWNTSPQKQFPQTSKIDFCPILSRTSSQSSGFESQAGSVQNIFEKNSRESSICGDDIDRASVFSEPAYNFNRTVKRNVVPENLNLNESFSKRLTAPSEQTFIAPSTSSLNFNQPILYHQFGTQRVNSGGGPFTFQKMTKTLPNIPKGSLLKDWINKNN